MIFFSQSNCLVDINPREWSYFAGLVTTSRVPMTAEAMRQTKSAVQALMHGITQHESHNVLANHMPANLKLLLKSKSYTLFFIISQLI